MIDIVPNSNDIVPDCVDIVLENKRHKAVYKYGEIGQQYADIASIEQKERSIIGCHFFYRKNVLKKVREKIKRCNVFSVILLNIKRRVFRMVHS
mgnify:CR=1 FL=1